MQLRRKPRNESQSPSLKRIHEGQHIQKSSVGQVPVTIPSHDLGKTTEKKDAMIYRQCQHVTRPKLLISHQNQQLSVV